VEARADVTGARERLCTGLSLMFGSFTTGLCRVVASNALEQLASFCDAASLAGHAACPARPGSTLRWRLVTCVRLMQAKTEQFLFFYTLPAGNHNSRMTIVYTSLSKLFELESTL
jgi:hypothetical protein